MQVHLAGGSGGIEYYPVTGEISLGRLAVATCRNGYHDARSGPTAFGKITWRRVPPNGGSDRLSASGTPTCPSYFELFDYYEAEANRLIAFWGCRCRPEDGRKAFSLLDARGAVSVAGASYIFITCAYLP